MNVSIRCADDVTFCTLSLIILSWLLAFLKVLLILILRIKKKVFTGLQITRKLNQFESIYFFCISVFPVRTWTTYKRQNLSNPWPTWQTIPMRSLFQCQLWWGQFTKMPSVQFRIPQTLWKEMCKTNIKCPQGT